jgi:signal transduction histidine kinase
MLNTITQYIDSQKLEEGLINPIVQRMDIVKVVQEASEFFRFEAVKKGIIFDVDISL